jgi:transcriptional regulator with XRE-family HTH domain
MILNILHLYYFIWRLKNSSYICHGMKERIKQFMDYMTLSAAELADQIGVQRSNVSHVMTGRNNPSSLFLEKLLLTFPELDARWLIVGEGQMLRGINDETRKVAEVKNLFTEVIEKKVQVAQSPHRDTAKEIARIVILYKDRTFVDYYPEN